MGAPNTTQPSQHCQFCGAEIGPVICCLTRFLFIECLLLQAADEEAEG